VSAAYARAEGALRTVWTPLVLCSFMVLIWLVITTASDGDVVTAVAVVPFVMLAGWRGWQLSLRLRARH